MNIVILRSANECKIVIMYAGILSTIQQAHHNRNTTPITLKVRESCLDGTRTANKRSPTQRVNFINFLHHVQSQTVR